MKDPKLTFNWQGFPWNLKFLTTFKIHHTKSSGPNLHNSITFLSSTRKRALVCIILYTLQGTDIKRKFNLDIPELNQQTHLTQTSPLIDCIAQLQSATNWRNPGKFKVAQKIINLFVDCYAFVSKKILTTKQVWFRSFAMHVFWL